MAESKWEILKRLRELTRERPKKFRELQDELKIVKGCVERTVPRRTLYSYLRILKTLGDVINEQDYWFIKEAKKAQFFRREEDREHAITHSLLLVLGNEDRPGAAKYPTHFLLQGFAMGDRDHSDFFQHLETGYPQIYKKLEDYRKVLKERGKVIKQRYGYDPEIGDLEVNFTFPPTAAIVKAMREHKQRVINIEDTEIEARHVKLFKAIAGEFAVIFHQVERGPNPLDGLCDSCPSTRYPCDRCPVVHGTKEK